VSDARGTIAVEPTSAQHVEGIITLCRRVYPDAPPWTREQLTSHVSIFPDGQFVAIDGGRVVGMAASLIVLWDDYDMQTGWRDFTAGGYFTNHDPERGRTLYAAEVMVDPEWQGQGVGSVLYEARKSLAMCLGLRRIRAGARLRGYHRVAADMSATEYAARVERGELRDATLSFQLKHGFRVIAVARGYLRDDPESLGYAAVIEWLNPEAPENAVR
jgi:GNAT superfamily N-acetyltransferase